ncbi:ribonuclease III domain-containing protein [Fusarium oxysporum]|nr:ribonuclease III domain-containing protein [Fusarium oxysporum]
MKEQKELEAILQYQFRDPSILEEALLADGAEPTNSATDTRKHGNKRLALIGDALLRLVLIDDSIIGGASRAESQKICAAEASNTSLHKDQKVLGLSKFIKTAPAQQGQVYRVTGASTIEALIGAVWVDSQHDYKRVHHAVHNLNIGSDLLQWGDHTFDDAT